MQPRSLFPVGTAVLVLSSFMPLVAQGPRQPEFASVPDQAFPLETTRLQVQLDRRCGVSSPAWLGLGAVAGGAVGLFAGALGGAALAGGDEYEALGAGVVGAVVGEITGVALGAHLANESRGDLFATVVGSGVGLLVASFIAVNADEAHEWVVVPLVQLPITVALQHYSGRENARKLPACRPI